MLRHLIVLTLVAAWWAKAQPSFEVASVKVSQAPGPKFGSIRFSPNTLTMRGITLWQAVGFAYGLESFQISAPDRIQPRPFFDIEAKASAPVPESQLRLMLRALVADRFHLKAHHERREMSVTALLVAKGGPRFSPSTGRYDPARGPEMPLQFLGYDSTVHLQRVLEHGGRIRDSFTNVSMPLFASVLAMMASKSPSDRVPVIDQTGLTGRFDFVLVQDQPPSSGEGEGTHATAPDVLDSVRPLLQKQLGLTLEHRKARVDVLVVDSAEKAPTPN
ncbi:MAG TPA: TIGR03435 family protein [Bryobacteraceae bacterium]